MDILMTIYTEIFPVAPVEGIIVVVAILVVDGEELPFRLIKLPTAPRTD
jgi:hypothetical protein